MRYVITELEGDLEAGGSHECRLCRDIVRRRYGKY